MNISLKTRSGNFSTLSNFTHQFIISHRQGHRTNKILRHLLLLSRWEIVGRRYDHCGTTRHLDMLLLLLWWRRHKLVELVKHVIDSPWWAQNCGQPVPVTSGVFAVARDEHRRQNLHNRRVFLFWLEILNMLRYRYFQKRQLVHNDTDWHKCQFVCWSSENDIRAAISILDAFAGRAIATRDSKWHGADLCDDLPITYFSNRFKICNKIPRYL